MTQQERDVQIARQVVEDIERIIVGATKDVMAGGGWASNQTSAFLISSLHGVCGAAIAGGRDMKEMADCILVLSKRFIARHEP